MAVNITWSSSNGGAAISDPLDHGTGGNGDALPAQTIYLEHDGVNQLTSCGFYLGEKSGSYGGDFSAPADFAELLAWGDGTGDDFGGFQINMDAAGAWPISAWPTSGDKQPTNGSSFFTGVGDSLTNKIPLAVSMGIPTPGTIQAGSAPNVRFQARIEVPVNEDTVGFREVDQKLRFTFTS
jgi:hypothetical protein